MIDSINFFLSCLAQRAVCARHESHCQRCQRQRAEVSLPPSAGTITNAAKQLHQEGAREVYACATHAVFSPPAVERLSSGVFQEVIVTNTIPPKP